VINRQGAVQKVFVTEVTGSMLQRAMRPLLGGAA
jgi:hypothetical protein